MRHASPSPVRTALVAALALLAACGSARKLEEGPDFCVRCHGTPGRNPAPPLATTGATSPADPHVGAHQAHLVAGRLRGPVPCAECHAVPAGGVGHVDGVATLTWGTLARTSGASPDYGTTAAGRCANTYCHGATLPAVTYGGDNKVPAWTGGAAETACGTTCHANPPPTHLAGWTDCSGCHPETTVAVGGVVSIRFAADGSSHHIDGVRDVPAGGCAICHGAPPATGAHVAHGAFNEEAYGSTRFLQAAFPTVTDPTDPSVASYQFGCGNCHPTDVAHHIDGTVQVDLAPGAAAAGSLKALNDPAAAYTPGSGAGDGTCAGVYCHSSGQAAPAFATTPSWNSGVKPGCAGCHANPPAYASGAAGSATANSHLRWLQDGTDSLAVGHFMGLPAVRHQGSAHGGGIGAQFASDAAAPITCQSCHYRTVDPTRTGPSGFYYLDTSGSYLPQGAAPTSTTVVVSCASCHAGTPPAGTGATLPLLHVNGQRDVVFDPRPGFATATGTPVLPGSPNTPTRPYWYSGATTNMLGQPYSLVSDAVSASALTRLGLDGTTFSADLSEASWNAADRSCSSVTCHLNRLAATSAPVQWGATVGCALCHNN